MSTVKRFISWSNLIGGLSPPPKNRTPLSGWIVDPIIAHPVIEPRINYAPGIPQALRAKLALVAAPGAVGKSALARHLAKKYNCLLVDLASSGPIGEHFIVGGLYKAFGGDIVSEVENGRVGLVFDALDEARLRVSHEAFLAFLSDIADIAQKPLAKPIVIFGRTSSIEIAWLEITAMNVECDIAEIDFFNRREAEDFVDQYAMLGEEAQAITEHRDAYQDRRDEILERLRRETEKAEGSVRFAGYAPVLMAIAKILGDTSNFALPILEADINARRFIEKIPQAILVREQTKMAQALEEFTARFHADVEGLYSPQEQRLRLLAKLVPEVKVDSHMLPSFQSDEAQSFYDEKVEEFIEQHPFLDGAGKSVGNAVFEADLWVSAILDNLGGSRDAVVGRIQDAKRKANPFLMAMAEDRIVTAAKSHEIFHAQCVGALYDSFRAREGAGEMVILSGRAVVHRDNPNLRGTEIRMELYGDAVKPRHRFSVVVDQVEHLCFPRGLGTSFLHVPNSVEIGDGDMVQLVAPSLIDVERIIFNGSMLSISRGAIRRNLSDDEGTFDSAVILAARSADDVKTSRPPRLAQRVELILNWPNGNRYPWQKHYVGFTGVPADVDEARLALRRLVLSFRSHSKGALARYEGKIEHFRMTRGDVGEELRSALLKDGVLSYRDSFYFLNPDKLGSVVGMSFHDFKFMKFSNKCDEYLRKCLKPM